MTFTDFVCLFLVVRGRAETGQRRPAHEHKNAVGRRECTGPQPFGQNTSLNPNSAQLK